MYFLASAGLLAIDLARHPSGVAVADVVDRVLSLRADELAALRGPASEDCRRRVLAGCVADPRRSTLLGGVRALLDEGAPQPATARTVVATLEETLLGGLDDVHALLRRELPPVPAEALQVALDAVTVAWAGRQADLGDLARLRAPWDTAVDPVPPGLPETPYGEQLRVLLEEVSRRTPEQWARVAQAHRGPGPRWSEAMHRACAAAFTAARLVEVARAQLAAARALRLAGVSTGPHASAAAMAVVAAVQGLCTRDLLDDDDLQRAWRAGS